MSTPTATQQQAAAGNGGPVPRQWNPCPMCHAPTIDDRGFACTSCEFRVEEVSTTNGHRTPNDSSRSGQVAAGVSAALEVRFATIDALRRRSPDGFKYVVRAKWRGCGQVQTKMYRSRARATKEAAKLNDADRHYTMAPVVDGRRGRHEDTAEIEIAGYVRVTEDFGTRPCECCGEAFVPTRSDQRFVNVAHKQRRYRMAKLQSGPVTG